MDQEQLEAAVRERLGFSRREWNSGDEATEQVRLKLYGCTRDKDGKIVEPQPTELEKQVRAKLFGSQETKTGSEIEEEPSISAETRAIERKIREQFGSKTYEASRNSIIGAVVCPMGRHTPFQRNFCTCDDSNQCPFK